MAVKSISPIRSTPSMMPAKSVAPMSGVSSVGSVGGISRPGVNSFSKLPSLGVSDAKPEPVSSRGNIYEWHSTDKVADAWKNISKYMPTQTIQKKSRFNVAYLSGFSSYNDYFSGLSRDFGAGQLKTFQTASGPQNLYDYQYNNLLKYGNINGPAMVSSFEFRDGKWWSSYAKRASYNKIGVLDLYTAIPGDLKTSYLARQLLTEDETESLYQIAQKNNLSQQAYSDLVHNTYAEKFFMNTASDIQAYSDALTGTTSAGPNISTTAQYGSLFGSQLQSDLKNFSGALSNLGGLVNMLQTATAGVAASAFGGPLGGAVFDYATGESAFSAGSNAYLNAGGKLSNLGSGGSFLGGALAAIKGFAMLGRKSGRKAFFETLLFAPFILQQKMNWAFQNAIFGYIGGRREQHKYNLVNDSGKIIDSYGDVTDAKDAEGISIIASKTGKTRDEIAQIFGSLYRFRVLEEMNRALESFNSQLTATSHFANLKLTEF